MSATAPQITAIEEAAIAATLDLLHAVDLVDRDHPDPTWRRRIAALYLAIAPRTGAITDEAAREQFAAIALWCPPLIRDGRMALREISEFKRSRRWRVDVPVQVLDIIEVMDGELYRRILDAQAAAARRAPQPRKAT